MLLIELSGEAPDIGIEEARALASAYGSQFSETELDGRALVAETDAPIDRLKDRLALSWSVSDHRASCEIKDVIKSGKGMELPGDTFKVTVKRLGSNVSPDVGIGITTEMGAVLSQDNKVDLESPDVEVLVLLGKRAHIGVLMANIDRSQYEVRKSENRPFSHPISLHPKFTRAMVNLTGLKEGQTLLDPFCGTGGVLLEAGLAGMRTFGSDIDDRMIEGTRENLNHFGVKDYELRQCDISEIASTFPRVDAIATDPPYGRSASTAKESIVSLYDRAFAAFAAMLDSGGRLVIVLPSKEHAELGRYLFDLKGSHTVRVHRSLTRHFFVFEKT